jgi:hypothetical protein
MSAKAAQLFLAVGRGDVVAVAPPRQEPFLAQVIGLEGGARSGHPSFLHVLREHDLALLIIQANWVVDRIAASGPAKRKKLVE